MALSKYAEPKIGDGVDTGKFKKLAHRVEETLTKECLFDQPKQIAPHLILAATRTKFSMQYSPRKTDNPSPLSNQI